MVGGSASALVGLLLAMVVHDLVLQGGEWRRWSVMSSVREGMPPRHGLSIPVEHRRGSTSSPRRFCTACCGHDLFDGRRDGPGHRARASRSRSCGCRPIRVLSSIALDVQRGSFAGRPVLVQLLFWSFIGAVYPHLTLGIPFLHVTFVALQREHLLDDHGGVRYRARTQ